MGSSSSIRADPKTVAPGRSICSTRAKPTRNSSAIRLTSPVKRPSCSRIRLSSTWLEGLLDVRLQHPDGEQRREPEVGDPDRGALPRLDAVVPRRRGVMPAVPAVPELESAEDDDDQQDRARAQDHEPREPGEADEPEGGMQGRHGAAAVERDDRQEVEQVDEEADESHGNEELRVVGLTGGPDDGGAGRPEERSRERDLRLAPGVRGQLLHADDGAEERNEERRRRRDALAPELEHVPELVHEDQQHEREAELPAPQQRIRADRDRHRSRRGEDLELEDRDDDELELPHEEAEGDKRCCELARKRLPAGLRLDRLVVALDR